MAKQKKSKPAAPKSRAGKDEAEHMDCGTCRWIWLGTPQLGAWISLGDDCKHGCKCIKPKRNGTKFGEIVDKNCIKRREVATGACGDHECEWEARQNSSGIWFWFPLIACPGGCNCPPAMSRPTATSPPCLATCAGGHKHKKSK